MSNQLAILNKKALNAALKSEWASAIDFNNQILEIDPKSTDVLIRLGRAHLQNQDFKQAIEIFERVLQIDHINKIALRNLELAKANTTENLETSDSTSFLIEPGTKAELTLDHLLEGVKVGQKLTVIANDTTLELQDSEGKSLIKLETVLLKQIKSAINEGGTVEAIVSNLEASETDIILQASLPVFKSQKQDVKPYMKKGLLDEPDLEMEQEVEVIE